MPTHAVELCHGDPLIGTDPSWVEAATSGRSPTVRAAADAHDHPARLGAIQNAEPDVFVHRRGPI